MNQELWGDGRDASSAKLVTCLEKFGAMGMGGGRGSYSSKVELGEDDMPKRTSARRANDRCALGADNPFVAAVDLMSERRSGGVQRRIKTKARLGQDGQSSKHRREIGGRLDGWRGAPDGDKERAAGNGRAPP